MVVVLLLLVHSDGGFMALAEIPITALLRFNVDHYLTFHILPYQETKVSKTPTSNRSNTKS